MHPRTQSQNLKRNVIDIIKQTEGKYVVFAATDKTKATYVAKRTANTLFKFRTLFASFIIIIPFDPQGSIGCECPPVSSIAPSYFPLLWISPRHRVLLSIPSALTVSICSWVGLEKFCRQNFGQNERFLKRAFCRQNKAISSII